MLDRLLEYCSERWAGSTSLPEYDYQFLQAQEYKHLETFVTIPVDDETHDVIRCNFCGRVFDQSKMASAVDHVASHNEHRDNCVDVFQETEDVAYLGVPPDHQSTDESTFDDAIDTDGEGGKTGADVDASGGQQND
jgi:hypothetical protein